MTPERLSQIRSESKKARKLMLSGEDSPWTMLTEMLEVADNLAGHAMYLAWFMTKAEPILLQAAKRRMFERIISGEGP